MSDTWSSEVQKYAYGVMFQSFSFRNLVSWRKLKGLGRILPSGRRLPFHRLQSLSSELQNPPWSQICRLRVWLLEILVRIPAAWRVIARICRAWFSNFARIQEFGSGWKYYSILLRVASSLKSVGSWIFIEAWCVAIGFFGRQSNTQNEKELDFIKGKFITRKADFTKESILRLCDYTPTILLLFVGT